MYYDILNSHDIVALDIDDTLVAGPKSLELQDWVSKNHDKKEIHLVTFRTGFNFQQVDGTLRWYNVPKEWFKGIHGIPQNVSELYYMARNVKDLLRDRPAKADRVLNYHKLDLDQVDKLILDAKLWKGKKCKEIGATVLVDDLEYMVLPGCEHYGIQFVSSI